MKHKLVLKIVLIFLALQGGQVSAIIGGREVSQKDFQKNETHRSVVGIVEGFYFSTPDEAESFCTGVLIARDLVLTAAHCVTTGLRQLDTKELDHRGTYVFFGVHNFKKYFNGLPQPIKKEAMRSLARRIKHIEVHIDNPDGGTGPKDLAILQLDEDAPPFATVASLVPKGLSIPADLSDAFSLGYGIKESNQMEGPTFNILGQLKVLSLKSKIRLSSKGMKEDEPERKSMLYVKALSEGLCHGDSGGPVFIKSKSSPEMWSVGGIASFVSSYEGCVGENEYNAFVDIRKNLEWINRVIVGIKGKNQGAER